MSRLDFRRAKAFVEAIPDGRWSAYADVAEAAGNSRGAQAIGQWATQEGHRMKNIHRVLTVNGYVPDAFRPAGPGVPVDAERVREALRAEGVQISADGYAALSQRFRVPDWDRKRSS